MIRMDDVVKKYQMGSEAVLALDHVSFEVRDGEYVAITGPSGSGKSTLMNIIGCLDIPDSGKYWLGNQDVSRCSNRRLSSVRSQEIGFVFQGFNLLGKLNALENVELPLIYQHVSARKRRERALEALDHVGLKDRVHHRPNQLSGGQQQRVAIARALVSQPQLILADEPTGNLDTKTGNDIMQLFQDMHEAGNTIVLITHDQGVAANAQRVIQIVDGRINSPSNPSQEEEETACNLS